MVFCLTRLTSSEHQGFKTEGWFYKRGKFFNASHRRVLRLVGPYLSSHVTEDKPALWILCLREAPISKGSSDGEIVVALPHGQQTFFAEDHDYYQKTIAPLFNRAADSELTDFYQVDRLVGEGAFAQVYLAKGKTTGKEYAVKVVTKVPQEYQYIVAEMQVARTVTHESIVRTFEIFETQTNLSIVMELMRGGELFDQIADAGHFSEKDASHVMRKIVIGISYLHLHGIVHRDLKPENILCASSEWPLEVKLCDFGLAGTQDGNEFFTDGEMIGTPGYVAPEVVLRKPYGAGVDMWAAGVILYIMLAGKMPFFGKTDTECMRRIATGRYTFPPREWANVSTEAMNLVRALLQVDPDKRLMPTAALNHNWLEDPDAQKSTPIANDLTGLRSSTRKFRKAVNAVLTVQKLSSLTKSSA